MDYRVKVRFIRSSRRKIGKLFPLVKGQYAERAIANLMTRSQQSSVVLQKAIRSGIANALFVNRNNNKNINTGMLWVKEARVDGGPMLKRILPRCRGSADRILRRMCHLLITLTDDAKPAKIQRKKGVGVITEEMKKARADKKAKTVKTDAPKVETKVSETASANA